MNQNFKFRLNNNVISKAMPHTKKQNANLHGFYVKGYKANPNYKIKSTMGEFSMPTWDDIKSGAEDLFQKVGVPALQNLAVKEVTKFTSETKQPPTATAPSEPVQRSVQKTANNTMKYALYGLGGLAGVVGIIALVKMLKKK